MRVGGEGGEGGGGWDEKDENEGVRVGGEGGGEGGAIWCVNKGVGSRIWYCIICGKGFAAKIKVRNHITCVHKQPSPEPDCGLCNTSFNSRTEKREHIN